MNAPNNAKKPVSAEDTHTILGPESSFEGKLVFNGGQVRIDGNFKGEVRTDSTLIVGESAKVEATIVVGTIIVTGQVHGDITAKQSVGIERPGRVRGTIVTPELMIQKGVIFEGQCKMESGKPDNVTKLSPMSSPGESKGPAPAP